MTQTALSAYVLLNVEPELDCWDGLAASAVMKDAKLVISLTTYRSEQMDNYADIMLPVSAFAETSGTYINNEGTVQSFAGAVAPLGETRPGWKILRVLGNYLNLEGFDYQASTDVLNEVMGKVGEIKGNNIDYWSVSSSVISAINGLQRISELPMNMVDAICRRAKALQSTDNISDGAIHINSNLAEKNQFSDGDKAQVKQDEANVTLNVVIDDRVPDDCVMIQSAHPELVPLGPVFGTISIAKA